MKFIQLKREKYSITSAIFFSLLFHFAVGTFLVFRLSTNSISSPKLNGIQLVWVSFDEKGESRSVEINDQHFKQSSSAIKKINEKQAKYDHENIQTSKMKVNNLGEESEHKENFTNINNTFASGTSDNKSNSHTVTAYPLYKENAPPAYPEIARSRGYEGIVLVFAEILSDGRVGKIRIGKSSGYAILDQSAIQAVKPWKFEPAKKSGSPFTAWVELPIKFILNNNSQS